MVKLRKIPTIHVKKTAANSEVLREPLPSKASSDPVNKMSNTHRRITHPTQDVTVKMKACVSLESFESVSSETLTDDVI